MRCAFTTDVRSSLLIAAVCVASLMWASAPAVAGPAGSSRVAQAAPGDGLSRATDQARARVTAALRRRARARAQQAELTRVYEAQLAEIDRLKQRRASWRRDRQLRERMSQSHATAGELAAIEERVRDADQAVRRYRRALVRTIDRELGAGPTAARRALLLGWRRAASKGLEREARKIVIPDDSIDPLADPEELEYQASLLRQSEQKLARELGRLDRQAQRYQHMAALRKKRSRAAELGDFDHNQPRRTTGRTGSARADTGAEADPAGAPSTAPLPESPTGDQPTGEPIGNPIGDPSDSPMFDVILADVVDASTVRALRAAEGSSDPAVKARAARRAQRQVEQRLERLKKRRKLMQRRARQLRRR